MKKFLNIFLLIFVFLYAYSQEPEMATIEYVTVNHNTQEAEIYWSVATGENIDGYIIKRKIWNGTGVVDGTFNNIAIIDNSATFYYSDNSTEYNTQAQPYTRSEAYRISSFQNQNNTVVYSNMSQVHATVFVEAKYDACQNEIVLNWNAYKGWNAENYQIFYKNEQNPNYIFISEISDTVFIHQNVLPNTQYSYYVVAQKTGSQIISQSNEFQVFTQSPTPPDFINANFATVSLQNNIEVSFSTQNDDDIVFYKLIRCDSAMQNCDTVQVFENYVENYAFTDTVSPQNQYFYKLLAIDNCKNIISESNFAKNLLIEANIMETNNLQSCIFWNEHNAWLGKTDFYEIYRSRDNSNFELIATIQDSIFFDDISSFINIDEVENRGEFCYFVIAYETGNPYGKNFEAKSNTVCIWQKPVIYIPNAFNPNSLTLENQIFKPKASFLTDYEMTIYNRWGVKIFETNLLSEGWTGKTANGSLLPQGAYTYHIKFADQNGEKTVKTGYVNLVW